MKLEEIKSIVYSKFSDNVVISESNVNEITIDVAKSVLVSLCNFLKDDSNLKMGGLMDISGVDYLDYGKSYWKTSNSTSEGFCRGHESNLRYVLDMKKRFCISYHLLSYIFNFRVRLRVFVDLSDMSIPSVVDIWSTADWHEREAYDFFGVIFTGHPNLLRILTDYGFEGHPLRKDFPLTGEYEVRYDENKEKIIREASFIKRVINTPKVIRRDIRRK